jgi:hypothetical protein
VTEHLRLIRISAEHWKLIRGSRDAVNRDCEGDTKRLAEFFDQMVKQTPVLFEYFRQLQEHRARAYGL